MTYLAIYDSTLMRDSQPGLTGCHARSRSHYEWLDYTACATRADVELTISIVGFGVTFLFVLLRYTIGHLGNRRIQRTNNMEGQALTALPPRDDNDGDGGAGISMPAPAYVREAEDVIEPPPAYTSRAPYWASSSATITPRRP